ncbi:KilA-N domain-containing protein [Colletotrichum sojae]|uniref:KilA-N domain-containing protein n=1 Tax=Colletotrichum sojae TaxID=2175907 RepID=A0A8H6IXA9_9PEZI|nr:KilA-N domain-containing protein [Colletotrichum sojae]
MFLTSEQQSVPEKGSPGLPHIPPSHLPRTGPEGTARPQSGISPSGSQGFSTTGQVAPPGLKSRVTTAFWASEGTLCLQVEARGIAIARREDNNMINGTKLLNVAGWTRGRRDRLLRAEKVSNVAQIGPLHLKGTWIPFERALELANNEKLTELLYPLFEHNIGALLHGSEDQFQVSTAAELRVQGMQKVIPQEQSAISAVGPSTKSTSQMAQGSRGTEGGQRQYAYLPHRLSPEPTPPPEFSPENLQVAFGSGMPMRKPGVEVGCTVCKSDGGHSGMKDAILHRDSSNLDTLYVTTTAHQSAPLQTSTGSLKDESRQSTEPSGHSEASPSPSTDFNSSDLGESSLGPKEALLNRLMDYFYSKFSNCPIKIPCLTSHGYGADQQCPEASQSEMKGLESTVFATGSGRQHPRKRKYDEQDDNGDGQGPPSKARKLHDEAGKNPLRLACPFFKRNPGKYQQRGSCTGPGWATAHRVKLKDEHFRASEQCEVLDRIPVEGIDATQKELLRRRQRTHKYMTEAEKWNEIYLILFPNANPTCLPSASDYEYAESSVIADESPETEFTWYEQFLRRELPAQVQRQLELRIEERLNPIEESLRSELVGIIRDTQIHLFNTYRSMRSSRNQTAGTDMAANVDMGAERADSGSINAHEESRLAQALDFEDSLQTFYQPPLTDDSWSFDAFSGLLFDFSEMPPGSVDLDSGYWSILPADTDKKVEGADSLDSAGLEPGQS